MGKNWALASRQGLMLKSSYEKFHKSQGGYFSSHRPVFKNPTVHPNKVLKAKIKATCWGAGDVDMRNVGVVASDHACDQKPRRKQEKEKAGDKRRR